MVLLEKFIGAEEDADEDEDERLEIARSAHAGMLHDHERHQKFNQALVETLKEFDGQHNIDVLDIGTGTGILSMMAARAAHNVTVTACEMVEPISQLATGIVEDNQLSERITVINKASTNLFVPGDMPKKADILVTEILDSELLGEGMLPTLNDAHKRLLSPNARVIPSAAKVNVQLIESSFLWKMNKLDPGILNLKTPQAFETCRGTANTHELQVSELFPEHLRLLSEAQQVATFDFTKPYLHNNNNGRNEKGTARQSKHQEIVTVNKDGILNGILLWWDLVLHKDKGIVLSMEPSWRCADGKFVWRDHWMQCVYYLPKPLSVKNGEEVSVAMLHDDYSVWFDVTRVDDSNYQTPSLPPPMCECGLHFSWPREIFSLWNDIDILSKWNNIARDSFSTFHSVLVVGEMSVLPLIFQSMSKVNVCYVECSEMVNSVVETIAAVNDMKLQTLSCREKYTGPKCDAIIFDPVSSSNVLPWQFLKTWSLLDNGGIATTQPLKLFPSRIHLRVCAVNFSDLLKARAPVKDIMGFALARFDSLMEKVHRPLVDSGGGFNSAEPYSMFEYKHSIVSAITTVATFNLTQPRPTEDCIFESKIHVDIVSRETAIVAWMDFELTDDIVITTGISTKESSWVSYSRQGVIFLAGDVTGDNEAKVLKCKMMHRPSQDENILFSCTL